MFSKRRNLVGYAGVWGLGRSTHMGRTTGTISGIHVMAYGPPDGVRALFKLLYFKNLS
jgi:hypothetical protein